MTIVCKQCKKEFIPQNGSLKNKFFCSKSCYSKFLKGTYPINLKGKRGIKPRTYHLKKRNKYGNAYDIEWRDNIFKRDNYTCQHCKEKGYKLQAHHIKSYMHYPEVKYDLNNGITLCIDCHKKTDNYGYRNVKIAKERIEIEANQIKMF